METKVDFFCSNVIPNNSFPVLSTDDIDVAFQGDIVSHHASGHSAMFNWSKITTPPPQSTKLQMFRTPQFHSSIFKVPPQLLRTPNVSSYLNIPSTPALLKGFEVSSFTSPCPSLRSVKSNYDSFVIPTPMIFSSLKSLARPSDGAIGPDILQLIEDDSKDVEYIDIKIKENNEEINDNNIVDYVLNITEDTENSSTENIPKPQEPPDVPIYIKRRKGRHAKRMTEEESIAYRERRQKLEKERRKERLAAYSKEEKGITRRSKRSQNKKVSYKYR
ncbi:hypothetical protein LOTGIDRAFT_233264 [Lottia gigantea]|uniref:Uncharacterized protein n=1 Tax=Lottia gigantea TaxID=225164 RepID=V4AF51_LOTGI|nr:hypothetical protein LOTGIDRAFT_233264 [Lottia gigantea]ESO91956.1 hypothetical protein LOTGIDRAFT_233264 [Lottia gigantea]